MTLLERTPTETLREDRIAVLRTERLVLRPPRLEDAETIAALVNDRRIAQNTARIPHPYALADAQAFLTAVAASEREAVFVVTLRGKVIGCCGIEQRDGEGAEIGYWLGVAFWGQGYATEAARAVIDHAFHDLGYKVLHAGARVSNPASRRVLEKCGFESTGVELHRIRSLASSAPFDRFRLERAQWSMARQRGGNAPPR